MLTLRNARTDGQEELKIRLKYYLWRDAKYCGGECGGGGVVQTDDAK